MKSKNTIAHRYEMATGDRASYLEDAREFAEMTDPSLFNLDGAGPGSGMRRTSGSSVDPPNHQSIGALGLDNLVSSSMIAAFSPTTSWFAPEVAAWLSMQMESGRVRDINDRLLGVELIVRSLLEGAGRTINNRRTNGFRSNQRGNVAQAYGTGDSLMELMDDYRVKTYPRNRYCTYRDECGDVLEHTIWEPKDPLTLEAPGVDNDQLLAILKLDRSELREKVPASRAVDHYTWVEFQPFSGSWVIRYELNEQVYYTTEEKISPFIASSYKLRPGDHYGMGFFASRIGDLRSVDQLNRRLLDFAAAASRVLIGLDEGLTGMTAQELAGKESGSIIPAKFDSNGKIRGIGSFKMENFSDFRVTFEVMKLLSERLGRSMLIESIATPAKERTTATQVMRIAQELQSITGDQFAQLAEQVQRPLAERAMHQAQLDRLIPSFKQDQVEITTLTGLNALSRDLDLQRLINAMSWIGQFGPEAQRPIDWSAVVDLIVRYSGFTQAQLLKSDEQLATEAAQQARAVAAEEAARETVSVAGDVARSQLAQQ